MERNGETLLLHTIASHLPDDLPLVVLDAGANRGSYTNQVLHILPDSIVHCFEIVPQTRRILSDNFSNYKNVVICEYGLSNCETVLQIGYNHKCDDFSREISPLSDYVDEVIPCKVITGDSYLAEQRIKKVGLLKIDVEGHDLAVLEGFRNAILNARISFIQFEYGTTWIAQRRFLHEAYSLLEPAGYSIGRLYPDGVLFKAYDRLSDDHFYMGNYVAVHKSCLNIIRALRLNSAALR